MAAEKEVMNPANEIVNAVKLVGDVVVLPGASLLMQGKVPQGGAHAILGVLAWKLLPRIAGPIGWLLIAANAYAKSTSGRYLHDYILDPLGSDKDIGTTTVPPTAAPPASA